MFWQSALINCVNSINLEKIRRGWYNNYVNIRILTKKELVISIIRSDNMKKILVKSIPLADLSDSCIAAKLITQEINSKCPEGFHFKETMKCDIVAHDREGFYNFSGTAFVVFEED